MSNPIPLSFDRLSTGNKYNFTINNIPYEYKARVDHKGSKSALLSTVFVVDKLRGKYSLTQFWIEVNNTRDTEFKDKLTGDILRFYRI